MSRWVSLPSLSTNRPNCENQSPDPSQLPRCPRSFCRRTGQTREVSGFESVVRHEQRLQMWTATPNTVLRAKHSRTQVSVTLTMEHRTGTSIPTGLTRTKLNVTGSMSDKPPRKTSAGFGSLARKTRQLDNDLLLTSVGCVLISLAQRSAQKSGTRRTW